MVVQLNAVNASVQFAAGAATLHHTLLNMGHRRGVFKCVPRGEVSANRFGQFMGTICSGVMVPAVHLLDGAKQEACRVSHAVMHVSLSVNAWTHLCLQTCKMITNDHGSTRRTVQSDYVLFNWVVIDPGRL